MSLDRPRTRWTTEDLSAKALAVADQVDQVCCLVERGNAHDADAARQSALRHAHELVVALACLPE